MPRIARLKFKNPEEGHYHIIARTIMKKEYLLEEGEKEYLLKLMKWLSQVYFVKVQSFIFMSNHIHIICQMIPPEKISDKELKERFELYYNAGKPKKKHRKLLKIEHAYYRMRFGEISNFIGDLKQRFTRWYNGKHNNHGHFWCERFKSVMLNGDRALLACMVYVELNAIRAGIVKRPEEYRYSGLYHFVTGGRASEWLDFKTLIYLMSRPDSNDTSIHRDVLIRYLKLIYEEGMVERYRKVSIGKKKGNKAIKSDFEGSHLLSFDRRISYFSNGLILGSKEFCESKFREFRSYFKTKKNRTANLLRARYKKHSYSAPEGSLLHFHTIRTYSLE